MDQILTTLKPENLTLTSMQIEALLPLGVLILGTLITILTPSKWITFLVSFATLGASAFFAIPLLSGIAVPVFGGMMSVDPFSIFFHLIFLACAFVTLLISYRYLDRDALPGPDYCILVLFSTIGMSLLASTTDFVSLFISLEIMSLATYLLVGYRRADRKSNEASLKYFIMGGAASAILLYGAALIYGATGSIRIEEVMKLLTSGTVPMPLFSLGVGLVVVGLLFKVAAVPFHMWMPDVYEGAPVPITGFMTTGVKAASFAVLMRILISMGYVKDAVLQTQIPLHELFWVVAVLTMAIGNIVALTQKNLKRMLAYSSISHTGYLLVGVVCFSKGSMSMGPLILYLVSYSAMNLGAFAVLTILSGPQDQGLQLQDLSGLSRNRPWLSFALALFLLSMAGIPPTAGFAAKYNLFYAAVNAGETPLVVIAVLCSLISMYYYLRVIVFLYMKDSTGHVPARFSKFALLTLASTLLLTLQVGIQPESWIRATQQLIGGP